MRSTFRGPLLASVALHAGVMLAACFAPAMSRQPAAEVVLPVVLLFEAPEPAVPAECVAAAPASPEELPESPSPSCVVSPHVDAEATPQVAVVCSEAILQEERPAEEERAHVLEPLTVAVSAPLPLPLEMEAMPVLPAVSPPEPLAGNRPPIYPAAARRAGVEGVVILRVVLDERGRVAEANVHTSSGHTILDDAARRAVRKWRFRPGGGKGGSLALELLIPVRFSLRNEP